MQHFSADNVRQSLFSSIDSILERRNEFLTNPQSDFTRTQKISFIQTMLFPMVAGSDNVATEMLDFFGEDKLPLPSAMIQRRNQVRPEAFQELFYNFTQDIPVLKTFKGYQLVTCDGSRINLPYNPSDPDSYIQCIKGRKGINQIHLNALYDPMNDFFLDVELQGIRQMDETGAFQRLLDKHAGDGTKRIYIADRGYASYNIFAHAIHNSQLFLIRVPGSFAKNICIDNEHWLEDPCADEEVSVHIGRRRIKKSLELENFHHISASRRYDFIEAGTDRIDHIRLRVLKFPISEGTFEYIATNLPAYAFPLLTIKKLYNYRWGQETAFRYLKYAGNMVRIHSLKKEFLIQEIYGKLTLYNFSSFISAVVECPQKKTDKHTYTVNHTQLQKVCIRFLKGLIKNVEALISRFLVPIRPGRKFERNIRRQSADTLTYR